DARALEWCEEARWHRRRLGVAEDVARMSAGERTRLTRLALQRRYFLIYRTLADPRYLDPKLDPSQRPLGSIFSFGRDPMVGDEGAGLARVRSARGWLSPWAGLTSNAALERALPGVTVPTLVVCALADMDIYPSECRLSLDASGAQDKQLAELPWAGHYLHPVGQTGAELPHPQDRVADEMILPWLRQRWPVQLRLAATRGRHRRHGPVGVLEAPRRHRGGGGCQGHRRRAGRRRPHAGRRRRALSLRHRIDHDRRCRCRPRPGSSALLLDAQPRRRVVLRGGAARGGRPGCRPRLGGARLPRSQPWTRLVIRQGRQRGWPPVGEDRAPDLRVLPGAGALPARRSRAVEGA